MFHLYTSQGIFVFCSHHYKSRVNTFSRSALASGIQIFLFTGARPNPYSGVLNTGKQDDEQQYTIYQTKQNLFHLHRYRVQ
jgi:hypothetical protein